MIVIRDFRVDADAYQRVMWRLFFGRQWPWFALPLVAGGALAAALADVRWLLVALMLACMAYPLVLALLHIYYALTPEARWSLLTKTATFSDAGVRLDFDDRRLLPRTIAWADIAAATRDRRAIYLHLRVRRYTFVMLPLQALADQHIDESALIGLIKRGITQPRT